MNKEMYEGLLTRRSIRSFKPEQVSEEDLAAVLKAGTYAPTAMGAQAPIIIAVQNPEEVAALNALNGVFADDPAGAGPRGQHHRRAGRRRGDDHPAQRRSRRGPGRLLDQPGAADV